MLETPLTRKIRDAIHGLGTVWTLKVHGGPMQEDGVPDLLICLRGRFIGCEVKVPGNPATDKQLEQIARIRAAGGVAGVATSVEEALAMCATIRPLYEFVVTDDRWAKCERLFSKVRELGLSDDQMLDVLVELGFQDSLSYGEDGRPQFEMTGVQYVAFVAAMAAVQEGGGKQKLRGSEDAPLSVAVGAEPPLLD